MTDSAPFPPLMPVYNRAAIYFERGEGAYLFDEKGQRYLDFVQGVAVTALGHAHPRLVTALHEQAQKVWTVSNVFPTRPADKLAQKLVDISFADTVFFQNSGVEAWDCCIKVIRKYFSTIGQPQRYRVITFEGCFHGLYASFPTVPVHQTRFRRQVHLDGSAWRDRWHIGHQLLVPVW